MTFDKNFGYLFDIGDYVFFRSKRGIVIESQLPKICEFTGDAESGYYKILCHDGEEFIDYHYVFELDIEYIREQKLKKLGI